MTVSTTTTQSAAVTLDQFAGRLEALRLNHGVKLIDAQQEGFGAKDLPQGSYGFSWSPQQEAPLFQQRFYQIFEVHKASDGEIYLVGFVSSADAAKLAGGEPYVGVTLYPEPWNQAVELVTVPRSRILKFKGPSRDSGNHLKLELGP